MTKLRIESVLLEYEGPQLLIAKDPSEVTFVGIAVPAPQDPHMFFGARISDEHLDELQTGRIDLYFAVTSAKRPRYITFSFDGSSTLVKFSAFKKAIPPEWLPERGFFLELDEGAQAARTTVDIGIDGRWDIEDLADYPQKLSAPYGFLYAMVHATRDGTNRVSTTFRRYPWRGGYSTVMFFKDLYDAIPKGKRVVIQKIHYASPGTITLQAMEKVMTGLHASVAHVNDKVARDSYRELRRGLSNLKVLGKAPWEVDLDEAGKAFVAASCQELARAIEFKQLQHLHSLTGGKWDYTAKYLLSYYRRLDELSDFYESGKASYQL
ncbi:MAG: hypothetical protein INH13_01965 [Cupriavidus sp.]|nr:hypothetical protein [Cupriavidus sp.]